MKPETFSASIQNDSDRLYLNSNRHVVVKNGGMVIIDGKEVTYQAEKTETINLKKKFTNVDNLLKVKGDFSYKIFLEDVVNITFDEYQLESWEYTSENKTSGYEVGQKLYAQKGVTSSDPSNVTGSYAELTVKKVDDTGKILNLSITNPGKYIKPPKNPVSVLNEGGEILKMNLEFTEAESSSILEKEVKDTYYQNGETYIELQYPISQFIENGELNLSKQIIYLHKPYALESSSSIPCQLFYDFTPKNNIPLIPIDAPDAEIIYNKAMRIIEEKFAKLEKRISNLENYNR